MAMQEQLQHLVFIPFPAAGHLFSMVELAKLLVHRHSTLAVSLIIITSPSTAASVTRYTDSLATSDLSRRIKLVHLVSNDDQAAEDGISLIESQKHRVREAVSAEFLTRSAGNAAPGRLVGFVLDMFCTSMLDVADELGVPSYLFFPSGAAFLGFMIHIQGMHYEEGFDATESTEAEWVFPSLAHPLPRKVLPSGILNKEWAAITFKMARDFKRTKGILVNTVRELESYAVDSLSLGKNPKVYTVGPILNLKHDTSLSKPSGPEDEVMIGWLDQQPESSVVFLCFGSMGAFCADQVEEIAHTLEGCGQRFLWSLRRPEEGRLPSLSPTSTDYEDIGEVLPKGFLDRTMETGRVIGWAPQAAVLAHKAVGGFVSHCGWNSTLESLWFGVPTATWPMYAEQQFNAFLLVKELGIATEIKMDYRIESGEIVKVEEISRGIMSLMKQNSLRKERMKEFHDKVNDALTDGGSSSLSITEFVADIKMNNGNHSGEIMMAEAFKRGTTTSLMEENSSSKESINEFCDKAKDATIVGASSSSSIFGIIGVVSTGGL